jgi:O-antigen ligase
LNLPSANDSRPEATRSTRAAERLVLAGAAIAIAGSAWLVDPFAEAAFDAPKRAAVLGGAALGALGLARDDAAPHWRRWSRGARAIAACLLLLVGWWFVAALASPHADVAWPAFRRSLLFLLLLPIGASRALDGRGGRLLLGLFALACASNALLSLAQFGGLELPFEVAQIGGRFKTGALLGNEGYVSLACAMLGAAGAAIAACATQPRARVLGAAALAVAIATIAANRQATSAAALLVAAVVVVALRCDARRFVVLVFAALALVATSALVPPLRAASWERLPLGVDGYQRLTTYRLGAWAAALDMAAARPWTGYGPGTYGAEQQVHRFDVEIATRARFVHPLGATFVYAHEDWLQLAAEAGWPALLLALAAAGALLHGLLRLARGAADVERAVLLALLATGMVAALAWFPMQIPLTASALLLATGRAWRLLAGEATR